MTQTDSPAHGHTIEAPPLINPWKTDDRVRDDALDPESVGIDPLALL